MRRCHIQLCTDGPRGIRTDERRGCQRDWHRGKQAALRALQMVLAVVALVVALMPVRVAWAQDATLTLQMDYTSKGKTVHVDGVTATAYRVASLDENINHYTLVEPFTALNVDFDAGVDAEQMETLASEALKLVKSQGVEGASATSDASGVTALGTLEYGVYLVAQMGKTGTAETYEDFEPFLISVPQLTEGDIVYAVTALPKLTPEPAKPTEPEEPETPKTTSTKATETHQERLSKTGDDNNLLLWAVCFAVGGALVLIGVLGKRRLNRDSR